MLRFHLTTTLLWKLVNVILFLRFSYFLLFVLFIYPGFSRIFFNQIIAGSLSLPFQFGLAPFISSVKVPIVVLFWWALFSPSFCFYCMYCILSLYCLGNVSIVLIVYIFHSHNSVRLSSSQCCGFVFTSLRSLAVWSLSQGTYWQELQSEDPCFLLFTESVSMA